MVAATNPTDRRATKVCVTCLCECPIEEFRCRYRGTEKRHNQCRDCYNEYQRNRKKQNRSKRLGRAVGRLAWTIESTTVQRAVSVLVRRFGGVQGFCREFRESLAAAERDGRYAEALRYYQCVMNLVAVAQEQRRQNEVPFDDMTDEELEDTFEYAVLGYLMDLSDEGFAVIAEFRGFRLAPLDDSDGCQADARLAPAPLPNGHRTPE